MPDFLIGTSGWHYEHWQGLFYPQAMPETKWLEFYSHHFNTVELNNSFYRLPTEKAFSNWEKSVSGDFIYAVKVSRLITHIKRLKNSTEAVCNFMDRAILLKEKLGPLLYQLPPNMKRDNVVLEDFLQRLSPQYRHVFEFRHKSWMEEPVFELLRSYHAGFCIYDMPEYTCPLITTSDFAYIRFHGSKGLYSSNYSDLELSRWARDIVKLSSKLKTVYIYFNNDAGAYAIQNAIKLREILSDA